MAPKQKVTKDEILSAAMEYVAKNGMDDLNARSLAADLGCSTQPIFSNYATMEELKGEVVREAGRRYAAYTQTAMGRADGPRYKASGKAYIAFAREWPRFFELLFMHKQEHRQSGEQESLTMEVMKLVAASTGLDEETAYLFHLEMWVYVHGIAAMIVTDYLAWDEAMIDRMLTDAYLGLRTHYQTGRAGKTDGEGSGREGS